MTEGTVQHSIYNSIGGEPVVRKIVNRFYDLMHEEADASVIRAMHPTDLAESRQKLFEFLSGFFGGPSLYMERRGHPRLRMRHVAFKIDAAARDSWLNCMNAALQENIKDEVMLIQLKNSFYRTAHHLINV